MNTYMSVLAVYSNDNPEYNYAGLCTTIESCNFSSCVIISMKDAEQLLAQLSEKLGKPIIREDTDSGYKLTVYGYLS